MSRLTNGSGGLLFLDAPGGTGKTFLTNLVLAKIRSERHIALALASSGIAVTLMDGGRTAHSALKLPLDIARQEVATCNISRGSGRAEVLKSCKLIVWDECTMAHKKALEALDNTLRDLRGNRQVMGGVLVLLCGDFRQTLPVIPKSTPADEIYACLKFSRLWSAVETLTLRENMRIANSDSSSLSFAQNLLALGEGVMPTDSSGKVIIPDNFGTQVSSVSDLIQAVYPEVAEKYNDPDWLCERAILAPKNDGVVKINALILDMLPGDETIYKSIDTMVEVDETINYPTEFLNSLNPPGLPPHGLKLKIGTLIILLRNLNPPKLCNGTRLTVKKLLPHIIQATILTGKGKGEVVFIPRIPLIPSDLPFQFKRLQFPVRLAFSMTINKAQGQSIKYCGINLDSPCFSHGQLYVGCSRVGDPRNLYLFIPYGKTNNIVYKQVLRS